MYGTPYGGNGYAAPGWYANDNNDGVQNGGHLFETKGPFMSSRRQRLNLVPMLLCLFGPWVLFAMLMATLSFTVHYELPYLCWLMVHLCLLVVVLVTVYTIKQRLRLGRDAPTERAPSWMVFMSLSLIVAWLLGLSLGETNYYSNLKPYYDYLNLNTYHDIYPNRVRGQQIMDAGAIVFTEGSHVDVKHSQGFRNGEVYCVAPIVLGKDTLATYDFWAIGKDCCSGTQPDFHCEGFNDPSAKGALRLMRDTDRPFYRLAVQQAEATYDIKATHPLFFHWVHDVSTTVESWHHAGWQLFYAGVFAYFLVQAFLVAVAAAFFSKLGRF